MADHVALVGGGGGGGGGGGTEKTQSQIVEENLYFSLAARDLLYQFPTDRDQHTMADHGAVVGGRKTQSQIVEETYSFH